MRKIVLVSFALVLLSGCAEGPTASAPDRPARPRLNSGGGFLGGSGNTVPVDSIQTQSTATSSGAAADTTGRGGGFLGGSGN